MTVRPGYISDGNNNWIQIGPSIPLGSTVYYQASEPGTPQTGDIWIDSDNEVPSIDNSQFLRWRKTVSGGETSLSGLDDSGLSLQYTPAYEQVYLNGVLLVRGADYTATTGTSITGLTALAASDVVEVFSVVARVVGDVYTQSQSDSKYSPITTTGLVLISSLDFTGQSSVSFNNVFSSSYKNYHIINDITGNGSSALNFRFRSSGTDDSSNNYHYQMISAQSTTLSTSRTNSTSLVLGGVYSITKQFSELKIVNPYLSMRTDGSFFGQQDGGSSIFINGIGAFNIATGSSYDGFTLYPGSGTITGTTKIYGYK